MYHEFYGSKEGERWRVIHVPTWDSRKLKWFEFVYLWDANEPVQLPLFFLV